MIALALCLITVPFSRYISPRAIVNGHDVYLAWLPLSVMLAVILLFGRRAIIPILLSFTIANIYNINLAPLQYLVLLICQTFSVLLPVASCALCWQALASLRAEQTHWATYILAGLYGADRH